FVRLGLGYVRGLRAGAAQRIAEARKERPFASLQDFVDRTDLRRDEQRQLAEAGALNAFGLTRRRALWQVEKAGRPRGPPLRTVEEPETTDSPLQEMTFKERLRSDLVGLGLTVGPHPLALYRDALREHGIVRAADLAKHAEGACVRVGGSVICRQRPGTAKG